MPKAPPTFSPRGQSAAERRREYEQSRGTSSQRLYDSAWERAARAFLDMAENALCRYCDLEGFVTIATLVDHFWPHRGDRVLFWRREFWVPSCAACHSGMKQRAERAGRSALLALAARLGLPPAP